MKSYVSTSLPWSQTITVHVKPWARHIMVRDDWVDLLWHHHYTITLTAQPTDGQANIQLISVLADYFGCAKREIEIVWWHRQSIKVVCVR